MRRAAALILLTSAMASPALADHGGDLVDRLTGTDLSASERRLVAHESREFGIRDGETVRLFRGLRRSDLGPTRQIAVFRRWQGFGTAYGVVEFFLQLAGIAPREYAYAKASSLSPGNQVRAFFIALQGNRAIGQAADFLRRPRIVRLPDRRQLRKLRRFVDYVQ